MVSILGRRGLKGFNEMIEYTKRDGNQIFINK
jgi:hypothetical protein